MALVIDKSSNQLIQQLTFLIKSGNWKKNNGSIIKSQGTELQIVDSGSTIIESRSISLIWDSVNATTGGYIKKDINTNKPVVGLFHISSFDQNILIADVNHNMN